MTTQKPLDNHHVVDLLPAYLNNSLDLLESEQVYTHLTQCQFCREELSSWEAVKDITRFMAFSAPAPSPAVMNQVRARLDMVTEEKAVKNRAFKAILAHYWQIFKKQLPIIHKSIWIASALVILFACLLALIESSNAHHLEQTAELTLALFATVVAASGSAFLYGTEVDPGLELTLATPTSMRIVMLSRMTLVTGYNFLLTGLASLVLAIAHGGGLWEIVQVWLGPMLLLSSLSTVLSMVISSAFALIITLVVDVTQMFILRFAHTANQFQLEPAYSFWRTTPLMLLITVLLIALALYYAPRQPKLAR